MGIFGGDSSGHGDNVLFTVAITCTVISLVMTFGITFLLPISTDYNYDEVQQAREEAIGFTGDTLITNTPWKLTGVYTPWIIGSEDYNLTDEGYLYGSEIDDYSELGKTTNIKLDVNNKSSIPLAYGETTGQVTTMTKKWWASIGPIGWIAEQFGRDDLYDIGSEERTMSVWNYTGYRYEFDPMLPFKYGEDAQASAVDGKLSIVWYTNRQIDGISGGLVIYGRDNVLLAQIEAADIVGSYNTLSAYSTKYRFDFLGTDIYLNIRFDPTVVNTSQDLQQAWINGNWTMAITSPSAGTFLDVKDSTSFATTLGNIVTTFKDIFTFDLPNVDGYWNVVMWMLVSFPAELAFLFFCSKLGLAGIPAAILGNALVIA